MRQAENSKKATLFGVLLAVFTIVPMFIFSTSVFAEDPELMRASDGVMIYVGISPVLALRVYQNDVDIDKLDFGTVKPTDSGTFLKQSFTAAVSTNNANGYKLYMTTPEVSGYSDAELTALNQTTEAGVVRAKIPSVTAAKAESAFSSPEWGYLKGVETDFSPIPKYNNPDLLNSYTGAIESDTTDLTVGIQIDNTLLAGEYKNTLIFTAVSEPLPVFSGITTMQEMNSAICATEWTPAAGDGYVPTTTLTDTRDGTRYTVSKLADGNCWMTQNLALGKESTDYKLDSTNSDLPTGTTYAISGVDSLGTEWAKSVTDEAGANTQHIYSFGDTRGNLYNWVTAVAGTANYAATGSDSATGTICPKGWTLPTFSGADTYQKLAAAYNVDVSSAAGTTTILSAPLNFLRMGIYNGNKIAGGGSYWTKTKSGNAHQAQSMVIKADGVAYGVTSKVIGQAVRCVAK